jgi:hypothetical protein
MEYDILIENVSIVVIGDTKIKLDSQLIEDGLNDTIIMSS